MKTLALSKLFLVLAAGIFLGMSLFAAPVRISFLRDEESIQNTLDFLKSKGCSSNAIGRFKKIVEYYNVNSLNLDFRKFPSTQNGFYSFESVTQLLAVMPHQGKDQPLPWAFNCYDTTILLGDGQFKSGLHPDDHSGEFLAQGEAPDGRTLYVRAETAREAYNLTYALWYQDISSTNFAQSMTDNRICLTAVLSSFHMLPPTTTEKDASDQVMKVLRAKWKWQQVKFPTRFQVVLCHQADVPNHDFATTHSGLLFPAKKGYVFIEKCGGPGPFVRFDFQGKTDLTAWLAWRFEGFAKPLDTHVFATFNDDRIETLHVQSPYDESAQAKFDKGDFDGAIADLTKVIQLKPDAADAYNKRGYAYASKGDWKAAIADDSKVIELNPKDDDAYFSRGTMKQLKGDSDGALADMSKAIELNPYNSEAYVDRGYAKETKGDLDGAIADYNKAIEISPNVPNSYEGRAHAKNAKGDLTGAINDLNKAIELDPRQGYTYLSRGRFKASQGDTNGAQADFKRAIELNPKLRESIEAK